MTQALLSIVTTLLTTLGAIAMGWLAGFILIATKLA
jgi:hypothetical protein